MPVQLEQTPGTSFKNELRSSTNQRLTKTRLDSLLAADEAVPMAGINDGSYRQIRLDRMGNQGVALHSPLFDLVIDGAVANVSQVLLSNSTQAVAQATGTGIALNSGASVAANGSATLNTLKKFTTRARGPLIYRTRARIILGGTNGAAEWGLGDPSGSAALSFGAMWQYAADGTLKPVIIYNGTVTRAGANVAGLISPNQARYFWFDIIVSDDSVLFAIQDPETGLILNEQTLAIGIDAGRMFATSRIGAFARTYVGATAATAPATQLFIGQMYVGAYDANLNQSPAEMQASMGLGVERNPLTGAQLANATNNVAPTTRALSNTTPSETTLGGKFQFAAPAGSDVLDYLIFGFQVPAGYQFNAKGILIDTVNIGAAVATTATLLEWDIGLNSTAASLATAGIIRLGGCGFQSFPIGAAIGAQATPIRQTFERPLVCEGGRFVQVILRVPVGTATASQLIRGQVTFDGYWGV